MQDECASNRVTEDDRGLHKNTCTLRRRQISSARERHERSERERERVGAVVVNVD
jgi:hypothetical protein